MLRRWLLTGTAVSFSLTVGCAGAPHLVPEGGMPQAVATAGRATITVVDQEWEASPDDLTDYVTPIPIELYNAGPNEIRISYVDFALVDEAGLRYKALNPFVEAAHGDAGRTDDGTAIARAAYPADPGPEDPRPVLLASRGGRVSAPPAARGFSGGRGTVFAPPRGPVYAPRGPVYAPRGPVYAPRGPVFGGYGHARPGFGVPGRPPVYLGWRAGIHRGGWVGYRPFPYYRPWLGPTFGLYWTDPFFWPPGYAAWVVGWGPGWYPRSATVPEDVVNLGLPEGVLQPGGRVAGYLYFQHLQPKAQRLAFNWEVHEARQGGLLGGAQVVLVVAR